MKLKLLSLWVIVSFLLAVMNVQIAYVLAEEGDNPITAPVTAPDVTPAPAESPTSTPTPTEVPVTPTPTPTEDPAPEPTAMPTATPVSTVSPITAPVTSPTLTTTTTVNIENLLNLVGNVFILHETAVGNVTQTVLLNTKLVINVVSDGVANSILIPVNTVISRIDDLNFNVADLVSQVVSNNVILAPSNVTPVRVFQWGLPNVGLQFTQPITLTVFVGQSFNGQALAIQRSISGTTGWTVDGLVSSSCVVSNGECTFQATKASYYMLAQSNSNTSQSNVGGSSSGSGSSGNSAVCTNSKPDSAPVLTSAYVSGSNQVTLVWSKAKDPVTSYTVAYGLQKNTPPYGNPNVGGVNTTTTVINGLSGNTTYFFQVRASNGCTPGDFSNELSVYVHGIDLTIAAIGYEDGLPSVQDLEPEQTIIEKVEGSLAVEMPVFVKDNILQRLIQFIKSLFV